MTPDRKASISKILDQVLDGSRLDCSLADELAETLDALDTAESERDQWKRRAETLIERMELIASNSDGALRDDDSDQVVDRK